MVPPDPYTPQRVRVPVLEGGAHRRAEPCRVDEEVRRDDEARRQHEDEHAERRDRDRAEDERRGRERVGDRLRHAAPDQELSVLHRDPHADHHEHRRVDRFGAERAQECPLAQGAERRAARDRRQHGHEEVSTREAERGERRVGAQRVELAVGEVHDVHQAEDEREADAQQGIGPAEHQAVHQVLKERVYQGNATLPSLIWTTKMLGFDWPLSLPAGPSFSNLIGPLTPTRLTFQRASRIALGASLPATRIASASVAMPSWPRNPSVSPSNGWPRLLHSSTNILASLPSGIASGNQGMKKTMW